MTHNIGHQVLRLLAAQANAALEVAIRPKRVPWFSAPSRSSTALQNYDANKAMPSWMSVDGGTAEKNPAYKAYEEEEYTVKADGSRTYKRVTCSSGTCGGSSLNSNDWNINGGGASNWGTRRSGNYGHSSHKEERWL